MPVKAVEPGADPEGRQSNVVGNVRDRLPLDTRPDDLRALHHPVGRRTSASESFHGIGLLCSQRSYLECHGFPSKLWFGGSIALLQKRTTKLNHWLEDPSLLNRLMSAYST
jgi:hypothetical protein